MSDMARGIKRTYDIIMLNFVNRYVVCILLAVGLHAFLLTIWAPTLQPIQLRLKSGHQAVSLQLKEAAERQKSAAAKAIPQGVDVAQSPLMKKTKASIHTNTAMSQPELITAVIQTKELKQHKKKALKNTPIQPAEVKSHPAEKISENPISADIPVVVVNEKAEVSPITSPPEAAAQPKGVFAIAQPLSANNPKYPRRAIMRNQQGRVKVNLLVDKRGFVDNIELIESSGYALLDESVFRYAEKERFIPATQDGIPIASTQLFLFRFVLE